MWLIICITTLVIEIFTSSLVSIWFSIGALIAFIVEYIGLEMIWQVITFVGVSVLTFLLIRPHLSKFIKSPKIKTNTDSLIGKVGEVIEDIDPLNVGKVKVNDQVWTAKSFEEEEIKKGSKVEILKIEGVKLIVKEKERRTVKCGG